MAGRNDDAPAALGSLAHLPRCTLPALRDLVAIGLGALGRRDLDRQVPDLRRTNDMLMDALIWLLLWFNSVVVRIIHRWQDLKS